MRRVAGVLALSVLLAGSAFGADPPPAATTNGTIMSVTVYRGQALVTREVTVPAPAGLREVVVGDLPERILPGSIYAESADGVEVRSVLYRERAVSQDVRADVRKLDDQIRTTGDQIAANERGRQVTEEQKAYLTKLEQFAAPTANMELTKGVLNAETLKTLTNYVFEQRKALADQALKLTIDLRQLNETLATLQRQRDEITAGSAKTVREAVVFGNLKAAGGKMRIRYMVDQATWDPSYNIRADGKGGVKVEYNASIQQQSGEDWTNVTMTLSTASPSLAANAPMLTPLAIALTSEGGGVSGPGGKALSYSEVKQDFAAKRKEAEYQRQIAIGNSTANGNVQAGGGGVVGGAGGGLFGGANSGGQQSGGAQGSNWNGDADVNLNDIAGQEQVAELLARDSKDKDDRTGLSRRMSEVISVTYDLPQATSLPSRSDRQLIQVALLPVKAQFFKVAVPVLTNYVYDQATLTNDSKMVLLAGPVASYMAGQFVGHADIPTVAAGEQFDVGFGIDSSLRASRERVDKGETVQGGNKLLNYTYRLSIENFAGEPVDVRLMDRLPTAKDTVKDSDIRVTLDTAAAEVSKDPDYLRTDRKKGLLRWDVKVPGQAVGEKAFGLEYKFKVEYDKAMSISGMPAAQFTH